MNTQRDKEESDFTRVSGPMAASDSPDTLKGVFLLFSGKASIRFIAASALVVLAARLAIGGIELIDGVIILLAVIAWPFLEWTVHVFLMHIWPIKLFGRNIDSPIAYFHRLHHVNPGYVPTIVMPLIAAVLLVPFSAVLYIVLLGLEQGLTLAFIFYLLGLLNEWTHLLTHTKYRPRSKYFQTIKKTHQLHHYHNANFWYAFTGPYVDNLFAKSPNASSVDRTIKPAS